MINQDDIDNLLTNGGSVHDSTGVKVGSVGQIYVDDQTSTTSWATLQMGLFSGSESFASSEGARMNGGDVQVAYTKDRIKDAPRRAADGSLRVDEENRLYEHYYEYYGLGAPSEERLVVGTETHESCRVRLRKYVVTENVTKTVPVTREELVIKREPVAEGIRGTQNIELGEEE